MVKPANKLKKSMTKFKIALLLFTIILSTNSASAQEQPENNSENIQTKNDTIIKDVIVIDTIIPIKTNNIFIKDTNYELGGISVKGLQKFEEETVKIFTGLIVGQEIKLPGDKLTSAIKKLYETKQFSNVEVYVSKIDGNVAYLEFEVQELPQLNKVTIQGVKKNKAKEMQKDAELKKLTLIHI